MTIADKNNPIDYQPRLDSGIIAVLSREQFIIRAVSQYFLDVFGYTMEEVLNRTIWEAGIISSADPAVQQLLAILRTQTKVTDLKLHVCTKSGQTMDALLSLYDLTINQETCWLALFKDTSTIQDYEQELKRLDRLNLIGEIAATVGHEVRNPMTTVRGFLQMMQMKDPDSEDSLYYNLMIEELDRANEIITGFLSVARGKETELQLGCLAQVVATLRPMLNSQAIMKNMNLVYLLDDNMDYPLLYLDEHEIRQMVLNLAGNGFDAMSSGGTLTIGIQPYKSEVVLYIRDQGCGIAAEHLDKIGSPFFTTKDSGTGLGLSVCNKIAARHGARIDIDTGTGGTTFSIHFPVDSQPRQQSLTLLDLHHQSRG